MKPSNAIINTVKSLWEISVDVHFVRKVENWIYEAPKDNLFIRITEQTHRSHEQIAAELDWLAHLSRNNIKCTSPNNSKNKKLIEIVSDESQTYYVSVFDKAVGKPITKKTDFNKEIMHEWGKVIAQMHLATLSYQSRVHSNNRVQWNGFSGHKNIKKNISNEPELLERYQNLIEYLQQVPKDVSRYGLIHADLHHGNFFVNEAGEFTIFDFDDCLYHWFEYDLAVPLFTLRLSFEIDSLDFNLNRMRDWMLEGYQTIKSVSTLDMNLLNRLIEYRSFLIYSWCIHNIDNPELSESSDKWIKNAVKLCRQGLTLV